MAFTNGLTVDELRALIDRNKNNGWQDLDPRERAFALEYLVHYSHRKAAEKAGYSASAGISLIRRPLVAAFIRDLQDHQSVTNIVTEDFVRNLWLTLLPKLMGEEEVPMVTSQGEAFTAKKFHASEVNSVIKELAKSTDFYKAEEGGTNLADVLAALAKGLPGA